MPEVDRLKEDLDYVASAVREADHRTGVPLIYFLWAGIVLAGFTLPDVAPPAAGPFWLVASPAGGVLSWVLGARAARRSGWSDAERGRRYALHWLIAGVAFLLCSLPLIFGTAAKGRFDVSSYMLVTGIAYALAGVHLERPLLWVGLLMLIAYAVIVVASPPYAWTITGVVIALALAWAGVIAIGQRKILAGR